MRLIDADKLKELYPHDEDWDYPVNTNSGVVEDIDNQPTVQAIPIEVLQEIRQEIDKWHHLTDKAFNDGIDTALEIIDKHIKEVE